MKKWIGLIFMLGMINVGGQAPANVDGHSPAKPLVVILMGPPGAGKGTHAAPLGSELGLPHISTGELFREHIRNETPLGKKAREYIDKGKLVPDELVFDMLFERVSKEDCSSGYILDGFPRTLPQAEVLGERLKNDHQVVALNFDLPDSMIVERISGRIVCKGCGQPYHKTFDPPKQADSCDVCKGPLYQRDDDKADVVIKRLEVYHRQTKPVTDYFSKNGAVFCQIDSKNSKDQVFEEVLKAVPLPSIK